MRSNEELEQRSKDVYGETDQKVDFFLRKHNSLNSFLDQVDQALAALDDWIKKSPHLQKIRYDRQVECQKCISQTESSSFCSSSSVDAGTASRRQRKDLTSTSLSSPACLPGSLAGTQPR